MLFDYVPQNEITIILILNPSIQYAYLEDMKLYGNGVTVFPRQNMK